MSPILVRKALACEIDWINQQYDEIGFHRSDFDKDFLAVALDGPKLCGVGRLVAIQSHQRELGGIYVLPSHRKRGIAQQIVEFLVHSIDDQVQQTWCIPFRNLVPFYSTFGFELAGTADDPPESIQSKVDSCNTQFEQGVALLVLRNRSK